MDRMKIAAIQMTSGDDLAANIAALEPLIADAVAQGAQLVATPENTFYMRREGTSAMADISMDEHPGIAYAQAAAKLHNIWLLIGSIRALEAGMSKPFNRSVLIAPTGKIAASYDKIHLFDVTLPSGQIYHESSQAMAGDRAVVANIAALKLGLSICYDLRFPLLYQNLVQHGASLICVPSAFTRPTGAAHWHSLLRARAIETQCYVIAPAQCGMHPGGRETYGHSIIVDPWGEVVAEASADHPQVIVAMFDPERIAAVRSQIPLHAHRRAIITN